MTGWGREDLPALFLLFESVCCSLTDHFRSYVRDALCPTNTFALWSVFSFDMINKVREEILFLNCGRGRLMLFYVTCYSMFGFQVV